MDIISHFGLNISPFQRQGDADNFTYEAMAFAQQQVVDAIIHWRSPIQLVGPPGIGKSVLLDSLRLNLKARGKSAAIFASPALAATSDFAGIDVALVDETAQTEAAKLRALIERAEDFGTILLLTSLEPIEHINSSLIAQLGVMTARESRDFLIDRSTKAGRPDLFHPAALDEITVASHGVPRVLKMLGNAALLNAMFSDTQHVEQKHAHQALIDKAPLPGPPLLISTYVTSVRKRPPVESEIVLAAPKAPVAAKADADVPAIPPAVYQTGGERLMSRLADARGTIAGAGALLLLIAGAALYGYDQLDLQTIISSISNTRSTSQGTSSLILTPNPEPTAPRIDSLLAELPLSDAVLDSETEAPEPAATQSQDVAMSKQTVDAPSLPGPGTPGYTEPTPPLPSVRAAIEAGIANPKTLTPEQRATMQAYIMEGSEQSQNGLSFAAE